MIQAWTVGRGMFAFGIVSAAVKEWEDIDKNAALDEFFFSNAVSVSSGCQLKLCLVSHISYFSVLLMQNSKYINSSGWVFVQCYFLREAYQKWRGNCVHVLTFPPQKGPGKLSLTSFAWEGVDLMGFPDSSFYKAFKNRDSEV